MKQLPSAIKIIINAFFFFVYLIISIILGNFVYGFFVKIILGDYVPGSQDPIHIKIAIIILFLVIILTSVFRKYFYISLETNQLKEKKIIINKVEKSNKKKKKKDDIKIYIEKELNK